MTSDGRLRNKDYRFFEAARQEALKSDFGNIRIGAVIVNKSNHIIGRGYNQRKSHPYQAKMNKHRKFHVNKDGKPQQDLLHAEIDAINNIPYTVKQNTDWKSCAIYVYRICVGHQSMMGLASPCLGCRAAIKEQMPGLKNVFYTTNEGFGYERWGD